LDLFYPLTEAMIQGVRDSVFPGAVLLVGAEDGVRYHEAFGVSTLNTDPRAMERDAVFDLASLTKPLAAAQAVAFLAGDGKLSWTSTLEEIFADPGFHREDPKRFIQVLHLLDHTSGLPSFRAYFLKFRGREGPGCKPLLRRSLLEEPLESPPGLRVRYSDLGYMWLEWIVETISGESLESFLDRRLFVPLGLARTAFNPRERTGFPLSDLVWTAYCPYRKRFLQGEVHDRNAFSVGGYSGHAGLFGSAGDVSALLAHLYRCLKDRVRLGPCWNEEIRERFRSRSDRDFTPYVLGFDTPSAVGSSAGNRHPPDLIGHLGFTGVSFWMDMDSGFHAILLTNRLLSRPRSRRIREFRPYIYERVWDTVERLCGRSV